MLEVKIGKCCTSFSIGLAHSSFADILYYMAFSETLARGDPTRINKRVRNRVEKLGRVNGHAKHFSDLSIAYLLGLNPSTDPLFRAEPS